MQVLDLFTQLSYGELASLELALEGAGDIKRRDQNRVLAQANTALTALHTRFLLRRAYHDLTQESGQQVYQLALPGLIRILAIEQLDNPATLRVNEAKPFGINIRGHANTIQILSHDTIQFPEATAGMSFRIEYQVGHPRLAQPADLDELISLPPALEEALQTRVAAGVLAGMGGEQHVARSKELMGYYEQLCQEAILYDWAQESGAHHGNRLREQGFI